MKGANTYLCSNVSVHLACCGLLDPVLFYLKKTIYFTRLRENTTSIYFSVKTTLLERLIDIHISTIYFVQIKNMSSINILIVLGIHSFIRNAHKYFDIRVKTSVHNGVFLTTKHTL